MISSQGVLIVRVMSSPIKKALRRQLAESEGDLVDLMPLHEAAGRPRGKSPIMWANRTEIEPGISLKGDGPNKKVWGSRALAQDYAHYLDRSIPAGHMGQTELKERGWTQALLERFLPEPDSTASNSHFRNAAEMKLYRVDRVRRIERRRSFKDGLAKAAGRKQAAMRAVATKTAKTLSGLDALKITVLMLEREEVTHRASDDYRQHHGRDVPDAIDRVTVNYIRHHLTEYEDALKGVRGKVGTDLAFLGISEKVFEAIEEAYPWLAEECHRQLDRRYYPD
jgi:hypothetical protein